MKPTFLAFLASEFFFLSFAMLRPWCSERKTSILFLVKIAMVDDGSHSVVSSVDPMIPSSSQKIGRQKPQCIEFVQTVLMSTSPTSLSVTNEGFQQ